MLGFDFSWRLWMEGLDAGNRFCCMWSYPERSGMAILELLVAQRILDILHVCFQS